MIKLNKNINQIIRPFPKYFRGNVYDIVRSSVQSKNPDKLFEVLVFIKSRPDMYCIDSITNTSFVSCGLEAAFRVDTGSENYLCSLIQHIEADKLEEILSHCEFDITPYLWFKKLNLSSAFKLLTRGVNVFNFDQANKKLDIIFSHLKKYHGSDAEYPAAEYLNYIDDIMTLLMNFTANKYYTKEQKLILISKCLDEGANPNLVPEKAPKDNLLLALARAEMLDAKTLITIQEHSHYEFEASVIESALDHFYENGPSNPADIEALLVLKNDALDEYSKTQLSISEDPQDLNTVNPLCINSSEDLNVEVTGSNS